MLPFQLLVMIVLLTLLCELLDMPIIDQILIMTSGELSKVEIERFTFHWPRILFYKSALELRNIQHAIRIPVKIFNVSPDVLHPNKWVV